jgi:hypothetical protein
VTTSITHPALPPISSHTVTGELGVHSRLEIDDVVRIDDDPIVLPVLTLLRQAAAVAATVRWSLDLTASLPVWQLAHLPPPQQARGVNPADLDIWRRRFTFGHCYYRRGPGFITVHDARREPAVRQTLIEPIGVTAIEKFRQPQQVLGLDPALRKVLPDLARSGLILRLGDSAMTLPWRPVHWPVPCTL